MRFIKKRDNKERQNHAAHEIKIRGVVMDNRTFAKAEILQKEIDRYENAFDFLSEIYCKCDQPDSIDELFNYIDDEVDRLKKEFEKL